MGLRGWGFGASLTLFGLLVLGACSGGTSPPEAAFTVEGESGSAPLRVQFTDTSEGSVDSWNWDFGDGSTSTDESPVHEYTEVGAFTVSLTVGNSGGEDEVTSSDAVTVAPGPLTDVVADGSQTVAVTELVQLEASAVDEFGNEIDDADFTWSTIGSVGTVDAAGIFTAGTEAGIFAGAVEVTASSGADSATEAVDVTILPGAAVEVAIEPATATVAIGDSEAFAVVGADEFGNEILDMSASWSLSAGSGEIDDDGVYTAGATAGSYGGEVVVTTGDGSTAADVVIPPGPLAAVDVQPTEAFVLPGESVTFTGVATDEYGNLLPGLPIEWTAERGEIDTNGLFFPVGPGSHEVTAVARSDGSEGVSTAQVVLPPDYPDFGSVDGLSFVGTAEAVDGRLRLTPALPEPQAGAAWSDGKVPVAAGFDTTFSYQIPRAERGGGTGLAFVIQTEGDAALGEAASGIGYSGIAGAVVVEIDTFSDPFDDTLARHISVHTEPGQTLSDHSSSIGSVWPGVVQTPIWGEDPHTIRVAYRPGLMDVYFNDLQVPLFTVWIDLAGALGAETAHVGFTAATMDQFSASEHYINSWTFTPVDRTGEEPPQPPPEAAFDGTWVWGFEGQSATMTIECCEGPLRRVSVEYSSLPAWSEFCEGPVLKEGRGRIDGAVLNVDFERHECVETGVQGNPEWTSYFLQPNGTLIGTHGRPFSRQ